MPKLIGPKKPKKLLMDEKSVNRRYMYAERASRKDRKSECPTGPDGIKKMPRTYKAADGTFKTTCVKRRAGTRNRLTKTEIMKTLSENGIKTHFKNGKPYSKATLIKKFHRG